MNQNETKWTTSRNVSNVHVVPEPFQILANEWLTFSEDHIGPDLQIGHIFGHTLGDQPILLLKACVGGVSLGRDLLPPGSKQFETADGWIYAGYGESPQRWKKGTDPIPTASYAGKQYDLDTSNIKQVLDGLPNYYPGATEYEIAAFVWWQGFSDVIEPVFVQRYEANLARLIQSLRTDLNASAAKFVTATVAFEGKDVTNETSGLVDLVAKAQLDVGAAENHPEFAGTVKSVDVRPLRRETGPNTEEWWHYWHNAEFVMDVGNALGWAIVELLAASSATTPGPTASAPTTATGPAVGTPTNATVPKSAEPEDLALSSATYQIALSLLTIGIILAIRNLRSRFHAEVQPRMEKRTSCEKEYMLTIV
jgi:hypothetical protein